MKNIFYFSLFIISCFLFSNKTLLAQVGIDFSHQRGFYNESFDLAIKTSGKNVKAVYTLDGSEPTKFHGFISVSNEIVIPNLDRSTVVRVFAYNNDETTAATHTYLFVDDVFSQNNNSVISELAYPPEWGYGTAATGLANCGTQEANYGMTIDECFNDEQNLNQKLLDGLMQIPTMSISLDKEQLFGADSGLYVYPVAQSDTCFTLPGNVSSWERKISVEIFNDMQDGEMLSTQVDAGIKISGGSSRYFDFFKHSFQLNFSEEYGASKFNYPLYGKKGAEGFKSLELRMIEHCSPHDWNDSRRNQTQYHKDSWARSLQKQLSGEASSVNSKFFHLFINGLYWGIYDVCERPDADYMATYYGGEPNDYDVIYLLNTISGSDEDYKYMYDVGHSIYDTVLTNPIVNPFTNDTIYNKEISVNETKAVSFYEEVQNYLDIESFIDYNLLNLYLVNTDWKQNNWWTAKDKSNGKFQFFVWDAEWILQEAGIKNPTLLQAGEDGSRYKYHPVDLNQRLLDVPEYKIKFGDHIQCNCVEEDGVLNPTNLIASYKTAEEKIHLATMLEFARWGNVRKNNPGYSSICFDVVEKTIQDYEAEVFPNLFKEMITIYGKPDGLYGLYALYPAYFKRYKEDGKTQFDEIFNFKAVQFSKLGGEVEEGYQLALSNPNEIGDIYYTIDGTDPRNVDGSIAATALKYEGPITISEQTAIKARVFTSTFAYQGFGSIDKTIDNLWSAMCPRKFFLPGEESQQETPVSIETQIDTNIKAFPKPVKNQLNIMGLSTQAEGNTLKVFSVTGQVLIEENITVPNKTINTSKLPNGHYIITVGKNNKIVFIDKVVKID